MVKNDRANVSGQKWGIKHGTDEGWTDQNGKRVGVSRGDLLLEGTSVSLFLITTNTFQFLMTTPLLIWGNICIIELGGERGGRLNVPVGFVISSLRRKVFKDFFFCTSTFPYLHLEIKSMPCYQFILSWCEKKFGFRYVLNCYYIYIIYRNYSYFTK